MNPSPLKLERHFFAKVEIESHVDGQTGVDNLLNCQVDLGKASDNARRFQVTLKLKLESPPDKKAYYTGEIHAVGLFSVIDIWPEESILSLVEANGPAVLFGAVRELILNLTSRGPWPPVALQTVTFVRVKQKSDSPKESVLQK